MNILSHTSSWSEIFLLGLTDCRYDGKGEKRGVFNVLGEVCVIRLGTVDCDDAHCYSEQVERSEQNSESVTDLLKHELC
jgi:Ran GTPase-activating protein (RanGAP) involved in mRNA processing and transport